MKAPMGVRLAATMATRDIVGGLLCFVYALWWGVIWDNECSFQIQSDVCAKRIRFIYFQFRELKVFERVNTAPFPFKKKNIIE